MYLTDTKYTKAATPQLAMNVDTFLFYYSNEDKDQSLSCVIQVLFYLLKELNIQSD